MVEERSTTYTATTGHVVRFKPIGGLLSLIEKSLEDPPVPTRRIETVGGDYYDEPMDEASAEHPDVSDEDKARWRAYVEDRAAIKDERWQKILTVCLSRGIEADMPDGDGWVREYREVFGLNVPDGEDERRLFWIRAEVIGAPVDEVAIVTGVRLAGMVRREVIDAAKAIFPHKEGVRGRSAAGDAVADEADVVGEP
jgi:hypothetical protein